ncbi:hypothetical protein TorRG33x02_326760 [Trema orientale]|uniref:Transmembrane protein n=1 Tax=Trema orientale TaxID=63057 RepID=A0A2P5BBL2_TREOI|nr:hypothetical protein TorRG33x02_326760 [Trema orientale]
MGLLRSLMMLCLLVWFSWLPDLIAQSTSGSLNRAKALDSLLQDYAYRAFVRPRTGIPYDGTVPSNLTGIKIAALRLRSGSLFRYGANYKEFDIPKGVYENPYVERLVLVYQNLGNWSRTFYNLSGYTYLAPVLGLLVYDASNLSATNLPELNIRATGNPILIKFPDVEAVAVGEAAKCVFFDPDGVPSFTNVISDSVCSTDKQGHFSIVTKSIAPSPAPVSPGPAPSFKPPPAVPTPRGEGKKGKNNAKVWTIVGSVLGGVALLGLLALLILWVQKFQQKKKMQQMERAADVGEALHMTPIGNTKAPAATVTRTQPVLESEYVP